MSLLKKEKYSLRVQPVALVALLCLFSLHFGFNIEASTGKDSEHEYLKKLGATSIIPREDVFDGKIRALSKQKWAAAVDPVGGEPLYLHRY